jgi:hypothetical protein
MEDLVNAKGQKVVINEGELICDHCGGKGTEKDVDQNSNYIITPFCRKCQGKGKVDWISNATGEKDEGFVSFSMDDSMAFSNTISASDIYIEGKSIIDIMSEKIAEEVDKKIMEMFNSTLEQKIKKKR